MDPEFAPYLEAWAAACAASRERATRRAAEAMEVARSLAERCRAAGARRVRLFGSLARGDFTEHSDIDLAVEGVPPSAYLDLYGELLWESPFHVDLVDLERCRPLLRQRVEEQGRDL